MLFAGALNQKLGKYVSESAGNIQADILKVLHHGTESLAPNEFFCQGECWLRLGSFSSRPLVQRHKRQTVKWLYDHKTPVFVSGFPGNVTVVIDEGKLKILEEKQLKKPLCFGS